MPDPSWDAVVVGAGPAGSTTAALLAGRGYRILLLDRSTFPRTKPCGESVNPGAVRELRSLGLLERLLRRPHGRIAGWRIEPVHGTAFEGYFPDDMGGFGISRAELDTTLLEHAIASGAELRESVKVVDLLFREGRVEGVRTARGEVIRSRLVVGADGLRSVVVRRLGMIRRKPRLRKVALTAHVQRTAPRSEMGELHLRSWGCIGLAQVDADVQNAVVVLSGGAGALGEGVERAFGRAMASLEGDEGVRRAGPVMATGPFDWPTRGIAVSGAILVGDAAGYYDPFTGQGIYRALRGARLAANAAERWLADGNAGAAALQRYEAEHRQLFDSGRGLQHVIEAVTARPRLMQSAAALLRAAPDLANRLLAVTGDLTPLPHHRLCRGLLERA